MTDDTPDFLERTGVSTDHYTVTLDTQRDDGAVPVFHIDVKALFGHIPNDQERAEAARRYAEELKHAFDGHALDGSEALILPTEVELDLVAPEGGDGHE